MNDYEELLEIIDGDNELSEFFLHLLDQFITKEPENIISEIEELWDDNQTSDKLLPVCPIPMNEEQRKILYAINNNNGKYILVDGPPGTGKSHTITSIIFQQIFENKSILVLSDKKEALDVVENKLTDVLDKVRLGEQDFQNPIFGIAYHFCIP